jgi:hypothetical protein
MNERRYIYLEAVLWWKCINEGVVINEGEVDWVLEEEMGGRV